MARHSNEPSALTSRDLSVLFFFLLLFYFPARKSKFWLRFINFESCLLPSLSLNKTFIMSCRGFCKRVVISLGPFSFKEAVIVRLTLVEEKLDLDTETYAAACFLCFFFFFVFVEAKSHLAREDYKNKMLAEQNSLMQSLHKRWAASDVGRRTWKVSRGWEPSSSLLHVSRIVFTRTGRRPGLQAKWLGGIPWDNTCSWCIFIMAPEFCEHVITPSLG